MNKNNGFTTISIKTPVVKRFREFSKQIAPDHTEALELMLDFFKNNEISPKENFGLTGRRLENSLLKRMNAIIAIIRDIEKNKITPTLALIQVLFEEAEPPKKKPLLLEKKIFEEKKLKR